MLFKTEAFTTIGPKMQRETPTCDSEPSFWPFVSLSGPENVRWQNKQATETNDSGEDFPVVTEGAMKAGRLLLMRTGQRFKNKICEHKEDCDPKKGRLHSSAGDYRGHH